MWLWRMCGVCSVCVLSVECLWCLCVSVSVSVVCVFVWGSQQACKSYVEQMAKILHDTSFYNKRKQVSSETK